jgi:hypothetical protein
MCFALVSLDLSAQNGALLSVGVTRKAISAFILEGFGYSLCHNKFS